MDYLKHYNLLMEKRKATPPPSYLYTENHHILPRSLGGDNSNDNIVTLTAREHFVAHMLLAEMFPEGDYGWRKMNHAFRMMCTCSGTTKERYINARYYELKREAFSKISSKSQSGKGNSQYGTIFIYNIELLKVKRILKKDLNKYLSKGWRKGRRHNIIEDKKLAKTHLNGFLNSSFTYASNYAKSIKMHHTVLNRVFRDHLGMSIGDITKLKRQKQNKKTPEKELHPTIQQALDKLN